MKIGTPDLVTNSYFPALAAEELGLYREEGLDAHVELLPSLDAVNALRDGAVDFVALARGTVDGFWATALGSETAVRRGVGRIIVDVRRGDGPRDAGRYTFAALSTTEALIAREPERVAAAVRAIVRAQGMLRENPARATEV